MCCPENSATEKDNDFSEITDGGYWPTAPRAVAPTTTARPWAQAQTRTTQLVVLAALTASGGALAVWLCLPSALLHPESADVAHAGRSAMPLRRKMPRATPSAPLSARGAGWTSRRVASLSPALRWRDGTWGDVHGVWVWARRRTCSSCRSLRSWLTCCPEPQTTCPAVSGLWTTCSNTCTARCPEAPWTCPRTWPVGSMPKSYAQKTKKKVQDTVAGTMPASLRDTSPRPPRRRRSARGRAPRTAPCRCAPA